MSVASRSHWKNPRMIKYHICIRKFNKYHKQQPYVSFSVTNNLIRFHYVVRLTFGTTVNSQKCLFFLNLFYFLLKIMLMFLSTHPVRFFFILFQIPSRSSRKDKNFYFMVKLCGCNLIAAFKGIRRLDPMI